MAPGEAHSSSRRPIGITGGIGEGKSTVLEMLRSMGFVTESADRLARAVFDTPEVNTELASIARVAPPIAPEVLRQAIGESDSVRRAVNAVTHPRIVEAIRKSGAQFIEVPLLYETCLQDLFSEVWVVTCGPREQRRRLRSRYADPATVSNLIATQIPTSVKVLFADRIIRTNAPPDSVRRLLSESVAQLHPGELRVQ